MGWEVRWWQARAGGPLLPAPSQGRREGRGAGAPWSGDPVAPEPEHSRPQVCAVSLSAGMSQGKGAPQRTCSDSSGHVPIVLGSVLCHM